MPSYTTWPDCERRCLEVADTHCQRVWTKGQSPPTFFHIGGEAYAEGNEWGEQACEDEDWCYAPAPTRSNKYDSDHGPHVYDARNAIRVARW